MNRLIFTLSMLFAIFTSSLSSYAAVNSQPKQVELKDAYKSLIQITTYNQYGQVLGKGLGLFVSENGEAVSSYTLFKGAHRAEVADYKGRLLQVYRILGASEHYDLIRFSTQGGKKIQPLPISTQSLKVGEQINLLTSRVNKKNPPISANVLQSDEFDKYAYYTLNLENDSLNVGCPLINMDGHLVAFSQKNMTSDTLGVCAIDARFASDLQITSVSGFNADLAAIRIPRALPASQDEARTFVYMAARMDSLTAHTALNDFISAYPDDVEGYVNRASFFSRMHNYTAAEQDFQTALQKSSSEGATSTTDEVHNAMSKQIYQQALTASPALPETWSFARAYDEAERAYAVRPLRYYLLQAGHCLYAQKKYREAYEKYLQVCENASSDSVQWSAQSTKEAWYYAAHSYELSGGDSLRVVALMDSVIAHLPRPVSVQDAVFYLERAIRLERVGQYRRAVLDYNEYETIVGNANLNAHFYYLREQLEMKCKMYQQALDDINTAIQRNPSHPAYPVEHALVLLRAGLYQDAIDACTARINIIKDNPDYYKIMGIAQGELGQKKQALQNLQKAKSLGDPTVDLFIEKYSK